MGSREDKIAELNRLRKVEELKRLRSSAQPKPVEPSFVEKAGSEAKAFLSGEGGSIGESVPIVGPLGRAAGEGFRAVVEGGFSDKETIPEAYKRISGENDLSRQRFAEEHPVADVGKKIIGGIGGAGAIPVPGAAMKGVLGAGTRIAGSAGTVAADAALRGESADRIKQGATMSGGMQAGLEAVPMVGKVAGPLVRPVVDRVTRSADQLKDLAATRAVKAAFGNNDKAWKELGEKRIVPTGKEALSSGIVTGGSTAGTIAERAGKVAKDTWGKVEKTFDDLDQAGIKVSGDEIAQRIIDRASKIKDVPNNKTRIDALQKEALYYKEKGPMSLKEAQDYKNQYIWKFTDAQQNTLGKNGSSVMDRAIGDTIKDTVKRSGVKGTEDFDGLYKRFGTAKTLEKAASTTSRKQSKNRSPFSLTDYIAGGSGGAIAASVGGDPKDASMIAALTATANNLARTRGNSALAASLSKLADSVKSKPEQMRKFYGVLENAAKRGQTSLAVTHQMLINTNPEYRDAVEDENP